MQTCQNLLEAASSVVVHADMTHPVAAANTVSVGGMLMEGQLLSLCVLIG